jgi:hypothetical protein
VIKQSKIRRKTVDLQPAQRPSRIRREPAPFQNPDTLARDAWWNSREWEIRLAIGGIVFFALAITALVIDLGELISH